MVGGDDVGNLGGDLRNGCDDRLDGSGDGLGFDGLCLLLVFFVFFVLVVFIILVIIIVVIGIVAVFRLVVVLFLVVLLAAIGLLLGGRQFGRGKQRQERGEVFGGREFYC
jgi:ABC-type multidrug transport system fused ATPase/permease subunit